VNRQRTAARIDTAALKRERPLADVVAAYGIPLRPQGVGRFWALCPFHAERTASFCVDARDPDASHYHCFACQAHGDVIDFVRQRENCSFVEACERLGARGRPPAHHSVGPRAVRNNGRRWDLIPADSVESHVLELAARIFSRTLSEHARAREYLERRGVSPKLVHRQRLGFADGRSLLHALRQSAGEAKGGASLLALAEDLGLVTRRPGADGVLHGYREFFFDRVMIPELRDGRPIWFIGRAIEEPAEAGAEASGRRRPKYLSLPGERPILGLEHVVGRQTAYLVEGPFDLLAAIGWGLPAFAICGTHVPPERLPTLGGAVAIYGVFDPDRAGRSAAERFAPLMGAKWRPVQLPNGMDLAELAARGQPGRELFEALVGRARAAAWGTGRP
jgi:DNA primase